MVPPPRVGEAGSLQWGSLQHLALGPQTHCEGPWAPLPRKDSSVCEGVYVCVCVHLTMHIVSVCMCEIMCMSMYMCV